MIYFFVKDAQFVQCEIYPGPPHILTVIEPGGTVSSETYVATEKLHEDWGEVCRKLEHEGWSGPFGRDARS